MQLKEWHKILIFLMAFSGSLVGLRHWRQLSSTAVVVTSELMPDEMQQSFDIWDSKLGLVDSTIADPPVIKKVNGVDSQMVARVADRILTALSKTDYRAISKFVHKNRGLHFAPYAFLHDGQQVLSKQMLHRADTSMQRVWGSYDGSGDPIELSFGEYHKQFVYDKDFSVADNIEYQGFKSYGNSLNNLRDYFKDSYNLSYYVNGTEEYQGMDWAQLRLVFDVIDGHLYLIALVHDQWTI